MAQVVEHAENVTPRSPRTATHRWKERAHVLDRFLDDPSLIHHRLVVGVRGSDLLLASPDRESERESSALGERFDQMISWDGERLPSKVLNRDCYVARHSDRGVFTDVEMRGLIALAVDEYPFAVPAVAPASRLSSKQTVSTSSSEVVFYLVPPLRGGGRRFG